MRTDYGVRAAVELASRYGAAPVCSADIATNQNIPEPYLDQLLVALRKAGVVRSSRGPQGGHSLARDPRDITVADVVAGLDGRPQPAACLDDSGRCPLADTCPHVDLWLEIDAVVWQMLARTTLADLVARQEQRQRRAMYYI
ncbi:MAG: Rrf2 family transcriptional regulator [Dehalococcoidia bacterium]|nr:Rrf2 family transcriptional regulator [Dehalococcoidia bacterium]